MEGENPTDQPLRDRSFSTQSVSVAASPINGNIDQSIYGRNLPLSLSSAWLLYGSDPKKGSIETESKGANRLKGWVRDWEKN